MDRSKAKRRPPIELGLIGGRFSQLTFIDFDEKRSVGYRISEILEFIFVLLLIFLACGVLSLPVIFYYVDIQQEVTTQNTNPNEMSTMNTPPEGTMNEGDNVEGLECLNPYQYNISDQRCHSELMDALLESDCPHEYGQTISVVRNGQQLAKQILEGFEFIDARESCLEEAASFICLFAYRLCSSSGVYIQPTSSRCVELRDLLCQTDWETAIMSGIALPNCSVLPSTPASCVTNVSASINMTRTDEIESPDVSSVPLECSDGFYRENGSQICIPSCYSWHQDEESLSLAIDVVIILIASVGTIAAIANLIIACLKPKRMCKFPSIFVVYMVLDALVIDILTLVTYIDRSALHCSSRSLLQTLQRVTPYCVITDNIISRISNERSIYDQPFFHRVMWSYFIFQAAFWWLFHMSVLFWKVFFPFHAHRFGVSGKYKYIHVVCLIIGIFLPMSTVITSMSEFGVESRNKADNITSAIDLFVSGGLGYANMRFPPVLCRPSDGEVAFYSLILPLAIIQAIGSTMLILLLWRIHRISVNKKLRNSSRWFTFGTAERKILIIFIYFELLASIALVAFTLGSRYATEFSQSLLKYFICELRGHDPQNPCSRSDINRLGFPSVYLLSIIIFRIFPVVIILYAVDVKDITKCKMCKKRKGAVKTSNYYTKPTNLSTSLATK